jgi:dTDP-4-dehydrorhamnose reductase
MLLGARGQVGWELERALAPLAEVVALGRERLDLARPDSIVATVRQHRPTVIVNAAAYTAVDRAEQEPDLAHAVNAVAPGILAEEARRCGALLVHYSTDYVFDGGKGSPYTEEDAPRPLNTYGRTKLEGERAIQAAGPPYLILRTGWVYGLRGKNFLLTIQRLASERKELRVVDDQAGAPTWSRFLAEATAQMLARHDVSERSGLYHLSAAGCTSWYGFARAILDRLPADARPALIPIASEDYPAAAQRPRYSVLDNTRYQQCFGLRSPGWDEQLRLVLED